MASITFNKPLAGGQHLGRLGVGDRGARLGDRRVGLPEGSLAPRLARLLAEQPAAFLELLSIDLASREARFQDVEGGP